MYSTGVILIWSLLRIPMIYASDLLKTELFPFGQLFEVLSDIFYSNLLFAVPLHKLSKLHDGVTVYVFRRLDEELFKNVIEMPYWVIWSVSWLHIGSFLSAVFLQIIAHLAATSAIKELRGLLSHFATAAVNGLYSLFKGDLLNIGDVYQDLLKLLLLLTWTRIANVLNDKL